MALRYNITEQGYVNAYGDDESLNREVTGDEPFTQSNYADWKQNMATGEWKLIAIDYKYIIVPNELIPSLSTQVAKVEDICFDKTFDYILQKQVIETRVGNVGEIATLTVKMTPCKVIEITEEDKTALQTIIQHFNAMYNPHRYLQCVCTFDNLAALDAFIDAQNLG